jgi:hypothetical protein
VPAHFLIDVGLLAYKGHRGTLGTAAQRQCHGLPTNLGPVCSCFSAVFFSRKAEKPKAETNGKIFN